MTTKQYMLPYIDEFPSTQMKVGDALTLAGLLTALPCVVVLLATGVYAALTSTAINLPPDHWLNSIGSYYFLSIPLIFMLIFSFLLSLRIPPR